MASSNKSVEPVAQKELLALTGYIRGGVTALACKKPYPVFLDENAILYDVISVSAGQRRLADSHHRARSVRPRHVDAAADLHGGALHAREGLIPRAIAARPRTLRSPCGS